MTEKQIYWLKIASGKDFILVMNDKPPMLVMRNLTNKGYLKNIMDTFFTITEEGKTAMRGFVNE